MANVTILPVVVIITGLPCTGKTTLARQIAARFRLPLLTKDMLKETLFDTLGWQDRAWSRKLGVASIALLYQLLEVQLQAGRSCIVESNFAPELATSQFRALQVRYAFTPFQILCVADGDVLFARFVQRSESGERHPGHVDTMNYDEFRESLRRGWAAPLDIGGRLIEVDTTDFNAIDYEAIFTSIAEVLQKESGFGEETGFLCRPF